MFSDNVREGAGSHKRGRRCEFARTKKESDGEKMEKGKGSETV